MQTAVTWIPAFSLAAETHLGFLTVCFQHPGTRVALTGLLVEPELVRWPLWGYDVRTGASWPALPR